MLFVVDLIKSCWYIRNIAAITYANFVKMKTEGWLCGKRGQVWPFLKEMKTTHKVIFWMGYFRPLFSLFSSYQHNWQYIGNIIFADDWIWTADLWSWKRLSHNNCPINLSKSFTQRILLFSYLIHSCIPMKGQRRVSCKRCRSLSNEARQRTLT